MIFRAGTLVFASDATASLADDASSITLIDLADASLDPEQFDIATQGPAFALTSIRPRSTTGTTVTTGTISDNSGAVAMNVPAAVTTYNVTGAGIRIGIISDSFNALGGAAAEEANGNLPATVTVLSDYTGSGASDEGRAMAELVHAVAPGAAIDFATGESTDAGFANAILALAAAGCNIIVDDLTYFDEPFFQDASVIQTAVETVIGEGISYFTSASNEGSNFYQATIAMVSGFLPNNPTNSVSLQDFGATAAAASGSDTLQALVLQQGETVEIDLQWTQPFRTNGVLGPSSAYSLALYLFNGTSLAASATTNVNGSNPEQVIQFAAPSTGTYDLAIVMNGGTLVSGNILKYIIYSQFDGAATILDSAAGIGSGSVVGHELLPGVNTVGAVPASNPSSVEGFSSVGPGVIDTYSGSAISSSTTLDKVDFLAPDGINTDVFAPFFGTSAAAPDAAAVAALMLQANPNLTPAQVSAALKTTATPVNGNTALVGAGLVNANAAVGAVYGIAWNNAGGGLWSVGGNWAGNAAPTTSLDATLGNDLGSIGTDYTVTVDTSGAVAETLTVGEISTLDVRLDIALGNALGIATGATVGQNGTLVIATAGTFAVGGYAELTDPSAVLTLQVGAIATVGELTVVGGNVGIGIGAKLTTTGGLGQELVVSSGTSNTYESVPYGLGIGAGLVSVGSGGSLAVAGSGGVLLVGGTLAVSAFGAMTDANAGLVSMLVFGGTLLDQGSISEANQLLVNTGGDVSIGTTGVMTVAALDVEGTGATLTVAGKMTSAGALTGAASGTVTVAAGGTLAVGGGVGGTASAPGITIAAGGVMTAASLQVKAATLTVAGALTSAGALTGASSGNVIVADGGTLTIGAGMSNAHVTLDGAGSLLSLTTHTAATLKTGMTSAITIAASGATIDLAGVPFNGGGNTVSENGGTLLVTQGSTMLAKLLVSTHAGHILQAADTGGGDTIIFGGSGGGIACYRRGTRIATPTGEVPVEQLRIGDPVLTAAGKIRPIHWIGRRGYDAATVAAEYAVRPIRIRAGALGRRAPRRDLWLSPQHALLLDDADGTVLVPAGLLVNGASIRRDAGGSVEYLHIELLEHDAILAEGQAAETFADDLSRDSFANAADYAARYPGHPPRAARFYAPRIEDGSLAAGPVLARIRGRIDAAAGVVPGELRSVLDRADHGVITGWVYDLANPDCPVLLDFLADGKMIGTSLADRHRPDLVQAGIGNGACGFVFHWPEPLDPRLRHIVSVRRAGDGAALHGLPLLIDRAGPAPVLRRLLAAEPEDPAGLAAFLAAEIGRLRRRHAGTADRASA